MHLPTVDVEKDCRGMRCPMPLLHTKLALKTMTPDQILKIQVTDKAYRTDLGLLIQHGRCAVVAQDESDQALTLYLKRC